MNIEIRNARGEDAGEIQQVFHKTWLTTYPNEELGITTEDIEESFKDAHTEEKLSKYAAKINRLPDEAKFLVAVAHGRVVGMCRFSIKEEHNQLNAFYVLPEYQRLGIGMKLWSEGLKYLDKNKKVIVQVATYNIKAIRFYEKLGFKDSGKRFSEERHRMPISKVMIPELEMEMWVK